MSHRITATTLALLLSMSACTCVDAGKRIIARAQKAQPIIDEDYRFRLSPPGPRWRLMNEAEIQPIIADALAGAANDKGVFGTVIAERAPGAELEPFARMVLDGLEMENKQVETFEPTTFAGKDAYRFVVHGKNKGIAFRYVHNVFLHDGFAYQVAGWGMRVGRSGSELQPFFDAFELLDGEVKERQRALVSKDSQGVGWRVTNGVFESAVTGLAVSPRSPWRVVVGEELSGMNAAAEVGLVSSKPDIYAVILLEKAPDGDREAFETSLYQSMKERIGDVTDDAPWVGEVSGAKVTFQRFRGSSPAISYRHAVLYAGGDAIQIFIWHHSGQGEQAEDAIPEALEAIRLLSEEERETLTTTLQSRPDPENTTGEGFSLRNGIYQSFQNGYRLKKPRGFWRFRTGAEARAENAEAELYFEEPTLGLYGLVMVFPAEAEAAAHHLASVENTFDERVPITRRDAWWVSEGDAGYQSLDLTYRIHTRAHGDQIVQVYVWGTPSAMKEAASMLDALVDGFEFTPGLSPVETKGARYRDHRFGFELTSPQGWRRKDVTPAQVKEVMSAVQWKQGKDAFGVMSLCVLGPDKDEDWFVSFMSQIMKETLGHPLEGSPKVEETTFAGQPARRLSWPGSLGRAPTQAYVLMRHRTLYTVYGDPKKAGKALLSFRLID